MKLLKYRMPKDWNLYQWGDTHEGTIFQSERKVAETIQTILDDPIGYCFHIGDAAESRRIDHPYYVHEHAKGETKTPLLQLFKIRDQFRPLAEAKKILWINNGNHEMSVDNFGNFTAALCRELGVDYGTWTTKAAFVDDKTGRLQFKGYFCHGFNRRHTVTSQQQDPKLRKAHEEMVIKKMLSPMAADCLVMGMGHYHRLIVNTPASELYLTDDGTKIKHNYTKYRDNEYIHPDMRFYCVSGAYYRQFLDGHDSYAEMGGYRPTEMGYIKYEIRDGMVVNVVPVTMVDHKK